MTVEKELMAAKDKLEKWLHVERIARVCHEANCAWALANGEDQVYPHWDDASNEARESSRNGVKAVLKGATARSLHIAWMNARLDDGWVYNPTRDNEQKLHPALLPYEELPLVQRKKDDLFAAIVQALR